MARRRLGEFPSVMVGLRIPGEWATRLMAGGKSAADAIREILTERFGGISEPKDVRRLDENRVDGGGTHQPRRVAVVERSVPVPAGDPLGPAVPEPAAVSRYVPPFEKALAKPEHFADCQCGVCAFAREAGIKPALPPKRDKKDDKKPAKKSRR